MAQNDDIAEMRQRLAATEDDADMRLSQLVVDAKLRALEDMIETVHDEQIKELDRKTSAPMIPGITDDEDAAE